MAFARTPTWEACDHRLDLTARKPYLGKSARFNSTYFQHVIPRSCYLTSLKQMIEGFGSSRACVEMPPTMVTVFPRGARRATRRMDLARRDAA